MKRIELLSDEDYHNMINQNRDQVIIGYAKIDKPPKAKPKEEESKTKEDEK